MLKPPKNKVWIHVNVLGDSKPWAVQYWRKNKHYYKITQKINLHIPMTTIINETQPRLVLEGIYGFLFVYKNRVLIG